VVIDFTYGDRAAFLCFLTGASVRITHSQASNLSRILMNRFVDSDPASRHVVEDQLEALKLLGMDGFRKEFTLSVPAEVKEKVSRMLTQSGGRIREPVVAIHPGARTKLRQWRPERFAELARRLETACGCSFFLVGGPGEEELLDLVEQGMESAPAFRSTSLDLLELAELFRLSSLFIGNDSAPGHLAAAVGCPTISLFGPTFPHTWKPVGPRVEVICRDVPCRGCNQEFCERPEAWCMDLIQVDEVWERAVRLLGVYGLKSAASPL
jgi:ADP-heptose:LPS heptosyltransferase